ncbi:unnamed protein product [Hydatigera taeniaeformis]|uniref:C2H2-type domain-containing protein n=1 Tax=Hydatigena taeniaeformis TaxID=6205 RepID=A0A0R3X7L6_HYDTA|nr:unnamed protein product [Hydatigera taeniaeformis]
MDERANNEHIEGVKHLSGKRRANSTPPIMSRNQEDSPMPYAISTLDSVRSNPTPSQMDDNDDIRSTVITPSENSKHSNLPPQVGQSESPVPSTSHDTPMTIQRPDIRPNLPNLAPVDLHLGNFPHIPLPQGPLNDPSPMFPPNFDLSGPSRLTPQVSPLVPSPLINGLPLLNNTSTLASSGFSAANLLSSNKPVTPKFGNIMQLFANMNNGEGSHTSSTPPSNPTLPYDSNYLNAFMKVNEQKDSTLSRPATDSTGPSVVTPPETLSNNSACTSPKSGNSESTSTLHQQPVSQPSTSGGVQPSIDGSISHDGKHCRVCNKRFNCGSALKIHFRKHSVPHLSRLPPPLNGTNALMTLPLVPPQNLLDHIFLRQSEQLVNPSLFEGAFRMLFENFLSQNNPFNDQVMQPEAEQKVEKETSMDVCENAEEPEDLSSSRIDGQGNGEGGLQCENPVNETLESHSITENGWGSKVIIISCLTFSVDVHGQENTAPHNTSNGQSGTLSIKDLHQCVACGIYFTDPIMYNIHRSLHAEEEDYTCSRCGECMQDASEFALHFVCSHNCYHYLHKLELAREEAPVESTPVKKMANVNWSPRY